LQQRPQRLLPTLLLLRATNTPLSRRTVFELVKRCSGTAIPEGLLKDQIDRLVARHFRGMRSDEVLNFSVAVTVMRVQARRAGEGARGVRRHAVSPATPAKRAWRAVSGRVCSCKPPLARPSSRSASGAPACAPPS
jgi:hypothetical protein